MAEVVPIAQCVEATRILIESYFHTVWVKGSNFNQLVSRHMRIADTFIFPDNVDDDSIDKGLAIHFLVHLIRRLEQWKRVQDRHPTDETRLDHPLDFLILEKLLLQTALVAVKTTGDFPEDERIINQRWLEFDPWFRTLSIFQPRSSRRIDTDLRLINQLERRHLRLLRYRTFVYEEEADYILKTFFNQPPKPRF
jgi:hypothetical protein